MIRETYELILIDEVHGIIHELFNTCKNAMMHHGNPLDCQQNDYIGLGPRCLGTDNSRLNYYQQLNHKNAL